MSTGSVTVNSRPLIGVAGALGVVFVFLKLTHGIAWPWIWVLAPFWIPFGIWLATLVLIGLALVVLALIGSRRRRRQPAPRRHFSNPAYRNFR